MIGPMESKTANAEFLAQFVWQSIVARSRGQSCVERGVEYRHVRQVWKTFSSGANPFERWRIVQRRKLRNRDQIRHDRVIDPSGSHEPLAAVNDTVCDRAQLWPRPQTLADDIHDFCKRCQDIGVRQRLKVVIDLDAALGRAQLVDMNLNGALTRGGI